MTRERPVCPHCGKKKRNERAMRSHIQDSHLVPSFSEPSRGNPGRWIAAIILIAAAIAILMAVRSHASDFGSGDGYGPGGRERQYDSEPGLSARITTRRQILMEQIISGVSKGGLQKFSEEQLNFVEDGFNWALKNGNISGKERESILFVLAEVKRERGRRK